MDTMIAMCGLDCAACEAYRLTQANDRAALEQLAAKWREEFQSPEITVEQMVCDGCLVEGRKCGYCAMCEIRACGLARALPNCAYCTDYASCQKLAAFLAMAPNSPARAALEAIRATLA